MKKKKLLSKEKVKRGRPITTDPENGLTPREKEILNELRDGKIYKAIAEGLNISSETVRTHAHKIYGKLKVKNRTEAINKFFGKE